MSASRPVTAFLTGEYPRATDTFIQREVAALRSQGLDVRTCSIRRTGAEHLVGSEQKAETASTFHVLEAALRPLTLLGAHLAALKHPLRYLHGLRLAWKTAPGGVKGHLYNLIYFAEAVVLAGWMARHGVTHLHNHIAKSSCTVAMLASAVSGIPYSFTLHGPDIFFEPYHWRLDEKIARARFVACISRFCRSQAMLFSAPEHWNKLHIVHCGIDPARYDRPKAASGRELLFIGRLAAVKGVPVLFEALETLLDLEGIRLTLIGDGPDRQMLEARARTQGLPVRFLGYRSQDDVADALAQADALVLASFAEGLPIVLMEALAARLPVIAPQIAGIPELVEEGVTGALVPPGDPFALAAAIRRVFADGAEARRMGENGRERVARDFDSMTEAAKLMRLIEAGARVENAGRRPATRRKETPVPTLGAVVIGRNEGERLKACLASLAPLGRRVVYVDSGSADGSPDFARSLGLTVVELDTATPFSAAKARNAGFQALLDTEPVDAVQFVDGDCVVAGQWLRTGAEALAADPELGLVTGWRSELHPQASVYNAMCEVEWHRPAGDISTCGGDMMVRAEAFAAVGGFDPTVIAAEDDEFCLRLGKAGWRLRRLPVSMTLHDADMRRFSQWWRRSVRNGHGFAQLGVMHPPHLQRERLRVWLYGSTLPLVFLLGYVITPWLSLAALSVYALSFTKTARDLNRKGLNRTLAIKQAALLTLAKLPNLLGMLTYYRRSWAGRDMQIIEYK